MSNFIVVGKGNNFCDLSKNIKTFKWAGCINRQNFKINFNF